MGLPLRNLTAVISLVKIKQQMKRIVPPFLKRTYRIRYEMKELHSRSVLDCDLKNLKSIDDVCLNEMFSSHEIGMEWPDIENKLEMLGSTDGTDGVNPGDRRAIYYLISYWKPSSVLEIGTHIGASTLSIASTLFVSQISCFSASARANLLRGR